MDVQKTSLSEGINLLPEELRKVSPGQRYMHTGVLITRYVLFALVIVSGLLLGLEYWTASSIEDAVTNIRTTQQLVREEQGFVEDFSNFKEYSQYIGSVHGKLTAHAGLFETLQQVVPQSVTLTSITQDVSGMSITGETAVYASINDFSAELQDSGLFSEVEVVSISRPGDTLEGKPIEFALRCVFVGTSIEEDI